MMNIRDALCDALKDVLICSTLKELITAAIFYVIDNNSRQFSKPQINLYNFKLTDFPVVVYSPSDLEFNKEIF